jgi:hypothetical protein
MTAAAADRGCPVKDGEIFALKMAASTTIYAGTMVSVNSAGYAIPAADSANTKVMGIAQEAKTNSGVAGDEEIVVRRNKAFLLANDGTNPIVQASIGTSAIVHDDQTVCVAAGATNDIAVGTVLAIEAAGVWVYIG